MPNELAHFDASRLTVKPMAIGRMHLLLLLLLFDVSCAWINWDGVSSNGAIAPPAPEITVSGVNLNVAGKCGLPSVLPIAT